MLNLKEYPMVRKTDRDCEIPNLLEFLRFYKDFYKSVLDVGARYTADYYAHDIRKLAETYDGLDPTPDPKVAKIVDHFIIADAVKWEFKPYDVIICCSTLEHIGQYPIWYKDYKEKRLTVFEKILRVVRRYFWFSFPVGQDFCEPGELALFSELDFARMECLLKPFVWEAGFFWSNGPQAGHPWKPTDKKNAFRHEYDPKLGTRSLCIIEGAV